MLMNSRLFSAAAAGVFGALLAINSSAASTTPSAPPKICIEGDQVRCETKPTLPVGTGKVKWHPGNYMMPDEVQMGTYNIDTSKLKSLGSEPAIIGAKIITTWGFIEGNKDDYSRGIAKIKEWLAILKPMNKRLVVEILTRRYTRDGYKPASGTVVPAYLEGKEYNGGLAPMFKGYAARIWEQPTMDRLIALYMALGKEFDKEPYFEAVLTDETALGFPEGTTPSTYSHAAYITQFKRFVLQSKKAFPSTNVIVQTNFMGNGIDDLAAFIKYCTDNQVGIGGPDIMHPPHAPLQNYRVIMGEVDGTDYRGKTPIGFSQEVLTHKGVSFTPAGVHDYAFNDLGSNYVFWAWHTDGTAEQNWKTGVLPFLRGLKTLMSSSANAVTCPQNLKGRCDPN